MSLRIGVDFDNTIVDYRPLFVPVARRLGLLDVHVGGVGKSDVRDQLRALPDGEQHWQRLQAEVYGVAIAQAEAYAGFDRFVAAARGRATLWVVSHKTRFAAALPDGPDLRAAALAWLTAAGARDPGFAPEAIYFEGTRAEKLSRIAELELTHFVDDLPEVLDDPAFPPTTRAILFRDSWDDVVRTIFN